MLYKYLLLLLLLHLSYLKGVKDDGPFDYEDEDVQMCSNIPSILPLPYLRIVMSVAASNLT